MNLFSYIHHFFEEKPRNRLQFHSFFILLRRITDKKDESNRTDPPAD